MSTSHTTDVNLTPPTIAGLTSPDAIAAFFTGLGYDTSRRVTLTPEAIGLAGSSAAAIKHIELLCEDAEGFLRIVFVQLRSLVAKSRNDLARVLGKSNADHLLILTSDFSTLEFVLLHKRRREIRGPVKGTAIEAVPLTLAVDRKSPSGKEIRTLRRLTWTTRDGLEQYDKLRSAFEAAAFTEDYFCNRALFADHFLLTRLREDAAWQDNPTQVFHAVRGLLHDSASRWSEKGETIVRRELYQPLFDLLGFNVTVNKPIGDDQTKPDYSLTSKSGDGKSAAFVYAWDRWLDGPDHYLDQETPDENPGACVVSALEDGAADWIIVTNGRQWRLYSKSAHSRATNFYEVDLAEAIVASGDTDPNEAFRYWWLFFRSPAFEPRTDCQVGCWLDAIAQGSRDYAKELGERLKARVFVDIFPHLAKGFLTDRKVRLGKRSAPSDEELSDTFQATLTLLYRLLFLLYAEARDLLPIREAPYLAASLRRIKEEIADNAGIAESEVADRLRKAYSASEHSLYDRFARLCEAMDKGDASLNVPVYNGGLFITSPLSLVEDTLWRGEGPPTNDREQRIARFLAEHKVPDRFLAGAIDLLARDPDDKTFSLVAIDYKSLEVRHLGSIYEGLLEFKLKVAEEDLATHTEKKREKYIPLGKAKPKRGKAPVAVVCKGDVYLSNDKAERKASGSYYTPDPIVEYIVEHTVGPVLEEKLEKLRSEYRKVRKTFDNELQKLRVPPVPQEVRSGQLTDREFAGEKTYKAHQQLANDLFDFRVLDPAMGSGHFLVEAVDFITDRLLAFLNQFPVNPVTFMLDRMRRNILAALEEQGVQVDPHKLTEVNLLKRHVLKRCIYGVDLNPMAVELAKVSLWLDAFTIGAPLSFLDHHLRCGNSLIGATFQDLEAATKGQLFAIDYGPLLRAIRHVLQVNAMADATSAEVKQSATEYGQARDQLAGYQIVLDLLVAKQFGVPDAPELLVRGGSELDLSSRSRFVQSLADLNELAVVEKVEQVASKPDLRFFHWEIEFPEVFFGFTDLDQRTVTHKSDLADDSRGFDTVIGNPPYGICYEEEAKAYFAQTYPSFQRNNDQFSVFMELGSQLANSKGLSSMIVPNTFILGPYFNSTKVALVNRGTFKLILDLGTSKVFDDPDVFSAIYVHDRNGESPTEFASGSLDGTQLSIKRRQMADVSKMPIDCWKVLSSAVVASMQQGVPLGDIAEVKDVGFNYWTVGRGKTRGDSIGSRLLYSGEKIHPNDIPYIKGSDFERFSKIREPTNWLRHNYEDLLDDGDIFRFSPEYLRVPQKIVYRQTADEIIATIDRSGSLVDKTVHVVLINPDQLISYEYLVGILNSKLVNEVYGELAGEEGRTFAQVKRFRVVQLPIVIPSETNYQVLRSQIAEHIYNGSISENKCIISGCIDEVSHILSDEPPDSARRQGYIDFLDRLVESLYGRSDKEPAASREV